MYVIIFMPFLPYDLYVGLVLSILWSKHDV